jgi:hypothetical protein
MTKPRQGRVTPPKAQLSRETLDFLCELVAGTTIRPTADDFEEVARKLGKARRELIAVLSRPETS